MIVSEKFGITALLCSQIPHLFSPPISFPHIYSGKALDLRNTLKRIDIAGWNYGNMETMVLPVNGESVLCGLNKANVETSQVFIWAVYIAFPPTQPQKVAFSGNAWKLPKWVWSHWEIPSIHRRNSDGCNESSPETAMVCSIKIIPTPNNPPISKVHSFLRFSLGGCPLSRVDFAQSDLLFYLISR